MHRLFLHGACIACSWSALLHCQPDTAVEDESADLLIETADKETNTECMFAPLPAPSTAGSAPPCSLRPGVIKRSQTFTPSAAASKHSYICRVSRPTPEVSFCISRPKAEPVIWCAPLSFSQLNRSDSDSCVPLNRKAPFKRGTAERKSLRWKGRQGTSLRLSTKTSSSSTGIVLVRRQRNCCGPEKDIINIGIFWAWPNCV